MKLIRVIQSKIVKKDNKYQVQSEKGKNLGTYDTKSEAEKRLKQVEMFKHMKKKSKLFTYDDLNKWYEEELRKQGFPADEQLHKEYDEYVAEVEKRNYSQNANLHEEPIDFKSYKNMRLEQFSNKNVNNMKPVKKWKYNYDWEETEEDPIEEPKSTQIE